MAERKRKDIRFLGSQTFKELQLKDNWLENYRGEVNDI